jgi:putative addiction module component (TIGR02574 family)
MWHADFMSDEARHLIEQALNLPVQERAKVISELLASLDEGSDSDADAAWAAEIERRAERALRGESQGKDWDVVLAELEAGRRRH